MRHGENVKETVLHLICLKFFLECILGAYHSFSLHKLNSILAKKSNITLYDICPCENEIDGINAKKTHLNMKHSRGLHMAYNKC